MRQVVGMVGFLPSDDLSWRIDGLDTDTGMGSDLFHIWPPVQLNYSQLIYHLIGVISFLMDWWWTVKAIEDLEIGYRVSINLTNRRIVLNRRTSSVSEFETSTTQVLVILSSRDLHLFCPFRNQIWSSLQMIPLRCTIRKHDSNSSQSTLLLN